MMTKERKDLITKAIKEACRKWQAAFNNGDAQGCASQYEPDAVMTAKPFGTFRGAEEIKAFWQNLIDDGFAEVEYLNPEIKVIDENSGILSSRWKMNKAEGVITKELWVLQSDGTAKLRIDEFEAQG